VSILGKGVLMLSANTAEFQQDLKSAATTAKAFEQKIKTLPEVGEKLRAGFGNVLGVASSFQAMTSEVSEFEKGIVAVNTAVSSMTVGMQLALKTATGLKGALLGTGIGALIIGAGALLESIRTISEGETGPGAIAPRRSLDSGERVVSFSRMVAGTLTPDARDTMLGISPGERRARELIGDRTDRMKSLSESMRTAGESAEDMIGRMEAERDRIARVGGAAVATSESFRELDTAVRSLRPALAEATERKFWQDYGKEVERVRTPIERVNVELDRMTAIFRRTGDATTFRRGIESLAEITPTDLEATRSRIEGISTAFETLARESVAMAERPRLFGILPDFRAMATFEWPDPSGFIRQMETLAGVTRGPLEQLAERVRGIGDAWEAAGAMAAMVGAEFDDSGFRAARAGALLDLARSMPAGPTMAAGLTRGSSEAISEINRISMAQQFEDPVERVRLAIERLQAIQDATRRSVESIDLALRSGTIVVPGVGP